MRHNTKEKRRDTEREPSHSGDGRDNANLVENCLEKSGERREEKVPVSFNLHINV